MIMKKRIVEIMDTTLRDGEQTHNVAFTPQEKLHISKILLEKLNVDRIEVASARTSRGEGKGVRKIISWAKESSFRKNLLDFIEILGFVDEKKSVDWIKDCEAKVINLLIKGSLNHLENQLKKTPRQHYSDIKKTIQYAYSQKLSVNVYLEDWSNGYQESKEYVLETLQLLQTLGVNRVMLPDTLGILYPGQVFEYIQALKQNFPKQHIDFHPHNDYGLGTANVLEAVRAGVNGVHTTINCLGERTGNASLAQVAAGIHDHLKQKTNIKESQLFYVSRMIETFSGKRLAANEPIVGEDVFTQTAGIHADGDKKGGLYHGSLAPARFGRRRSYALGKLAGKASLEQNLKELGIEMSEENLKKVLKKIVELGDQKKIVTVQDVPFIIADVLKLPEHRKVEINNIVITSGKKISPVCSMSIKYKDREANVSALGDGGYDAFMNAVSQWSREMRIHLPELIDYEVRIPPGGKTSALVECKIIWQKKNNSGLLTTRGVDSDQVMASVYATEKMLNLVL